VAGECGGALPEPADQRDAPLDPNFLGNGRTRTDGQGRCAFLTIKPGASTVPDSGRWWRPPHIHMSLLGSSCLSRLVTQMYFPGDPINAEDRLLNSVADPAARCSLVCCQVPTSEVEGEWLALVHDLVLRGRRATPELP
jgi:protocatechuate 3,4-dioxygenase beta subunit